MCPGETLLPCRHAASPHPSVGDRPLAEATGDRGMAATLSYDLGPREAERHQLGGPGWGRGEEIPEPGKADASWRTGGTPVTLEIGCQCISKPRTACGCPGVPWPNQTSLQGLHRPTLSGRPCSPRARPSRGGAVADGMYVWECSSEVPAAWAGAVIALCVLEALWTSHRPQALSLRCCLWPHPRAEPSQAESGVCAFECW